MIAKKKRLKDDTIIIDGREAHLVQKYPSCNFRWYLSDDNPPTLQQLICKHYRVNLTEEERKAAYDGKLKFRLTKDVKEWIDIPLSSDPPPYTSFFEDVDLDERLTTPKKT